MNTKRSIIEFFASHLPEYDFRPDLRPNLIFQWPQESGIYRCLSIQRDSASCGLAPSIAVTYNSSWRGEPAYPLGLDAALVELKLGTRSVEILKHWTFYESTPTGLSRALEKILEDIHHYSPAFFERTEREMASNRLLQLARIEARKVSSEQRAGLREELARVKYRLADLKHPSFVRVRDAIRAGWDVQTSDAERSVTNRIACDCLLLGDRVAGGTLHESTVRSSIGEKKSNPKK